MISNTRIVIFAKAPVAGHAKTRLIPALGADGAAKLAGRMLAVTLAQARDAAPLKIELCVTPDACDAAWAGRLPRGVAVSNQGPGDLGVRLAATAKRILDGSERAILIGTDCPALTSTRLRAAADALESHDAVMHPALDGGYVLLGLSRFDPSLFSGIAWSSATVCAETQARIKALAWRLLVGETLRDVDEPADLEAVKGWL